MKVPLDLTQEGIQHSAWICLALTDQNQKKGMKYNYLMRC